MPPTPQLGHLVQELVVPMVKEEVLEEFSAVTDEVGGEAGCRGECANTHVHKPKLFENSGYVQVFELLYTCTFFVFQFFTYIYIDCRI